MSIDLKKQLKYMEAKAEKRRIKYPQEISGIKFKESRSYIPKGILSRADCGDLVAVRPCEEKFGNKTYLGFFLGEIALSQYASLDKDTKELSVSVSHHNPAMFVPELKTVIFGCGSWWHKIDKKEDLEQITDKDISNVWYVKALKEFDKEQV